MGHVGRDEETAAKRSFIDITRKGRGAVDTVDAAVDGLFHEDTVGTSIADAAHFFVVKEGGNTDVLLRIEITRAVDEGLHASVAVEEVVETGREDELVVGSSQTSWLRVSKTQLDLSDLVPLDRELSADEIEEGVTVGPRGIAVEGVVLLSGLFL